MYLLPSRNRLADLRLEWSCTLPLLCKPSPLVQVKALGWLGWLPKQCHARTAMGFTLAELLIALAILGVIATMTIPKIITAQQNGKFNAIAKEDIAAISGAYEQAQLNGTASTNTTIGDLTPYLNYLTVDTTTAIDDFTGSTSQNCSVGTLVCLAMQNGSMVRYRTNSAFGGTATSNGIYIHVDPAAGYSGTTDSGKLMLVMIYYNGKVTDGANIPTTTNTFATYGASASYTPSWFSW